MQMPEDSEDLTPDEPFDMNSFVADLIAKEGDDDETVVEDGPEEIPEGELPEDDDSPSTEDDESAEADEPDTEEVEQEEKEGDDDEVVEDEPKAEAKDDPRDAEIEALKELARSQNQQLIDILGKQVALNQQQAQAPKEPQAPAIRDEVAQLALFGGDEEAWKALSPVERAEGTKFAKAYMARVTRHAKNPEALYTDLVQAQVQAEIQKAMAPLLQDTHKQRGQVLIERHAKDLLENHRERLLEVFNELPGSRSDNWKDLEASLKAASTLVRNEVSRQDLETRERKVETSKRQKRANKEAAQKRGRRGSGRSSNKTKTSGWNPDSMDLAGFAQSLQDKE